MVNLQYLLKKLNPTLFCSAEWSVKDRNWDRLCISVTLPILVFLCPLHDLAFVPSKSFLSAFYKTPNQIYSRKNFQQYLTNKNLCKKVVLSQFQNIRWTKSIWDSQKVNFEFWISRIDFKKSMLVLYFGTEEVLFMGK